MVLRDCSNVHIDVRSTYAVMSVGEKNYACTLGPYMCMTPVSVSIMMHIMMMMITESGRIVLEGGSARVLVGGVACRACAYACACVSLGRTGAYG